MALSKLVLETGEIYKVGESCPFQRWLRVVSIKRRGKVYIIQRERWDTHRVIDGDLTVTASDVRSVS